VLAAPPPEPQNRSTFSWRLRNALRRAGSGLPPRGEVLFPGVANDLYHAHLAQYRFAGRFAAGARSLDLGCGTGYGSAELLAAGAAEVVGIDPHRSSILYAKRRFGSRAARFRVGRAEDLGGELGRFDLTVAVNVLPQVADVEAALRGVASLLAPEGRLIASLPPLLDGQALSLYRVNPKHRTALLLWDWLDLLRGHFAAVRLFRQLAPARRSPDLGSPVPATVRAEDYAFEELPLADLDDVGSLAAVAVCQGAG
jgi:SAM-dependent methyltransferase